MVVIENSKDTIEKGVVDLPYTYIDGEQRVYDCEHEEMQLLFEESLYRLQYAIPRNWRLRFARRSRRKVGIEQLLSLLWREKGAFPSSILSIQMCLMGSNHLEVGEPVRKG